MGRQFINNDKNERVKVTLVINHELLIDARERNMNLSRLLENAIILALEAHEHASPAPIMLEQDT